MTDSNMIPFDLTVFLAAVGEGHTTVKLRPNRVVFAQGDLADGVFYLQQGKVKTTIMAESGKEAVLTILGRGEFLGHNCLAGQMRRAFSATTMTDCTITRIEQVTMTRVLAQHPAFSHYFTDFLLRRSIRMQEDLADQLFNSSEQRLARILLILANYGQAGTTEIISPKISHETLAEMVGTTRARVSSFMNRFRRLGFIDYNGEIKVHASLLKVLLHD